MSVINQGQAQTRAEEIRTETVANANTAQRVGSLFKDIVDSLKWVAFSAGVAGLVPAPDSGGGDAAKFLRGDGVWAAVSATFSPSNPGDDGKLAYASGGAAAFAANIKTNGTYLQFGTTAATSGTLRFGNDVFLVGIKAGGGADVGLLGIGADDATYTGDLNTTAHYIRSGGSVVIRSDGDNANAFLMKKTGLAIATVASTGTVIPAFKVTDAEHTALAASTERHSVHFDLSQTRTWATGAITNQRSFRIQAGVIKHLASSVVSTAATVAISGAPTVFDANTTITNALALWVEAGGVGYGTGAIALAGLHRTTHGVEFWRATKSTGAGSEVSLLRFGTPTTDWLTVGAGGGTGLAGIDYRVGSGGSHTWTVDSTVEFEITASAIDCKSNGLTNVASINGQTFAFALAGTNLTDADQTITVSQGNRRVSSLPLTANRITTLGVSDTPRFGAVIRIERIDGGANSRTIKDHLGNELHVFPPSTLEAAEFRYNGTKYEFCGHTGLAA